MWQLLTASVIWAFSFGLIKAYLADVDATFVAFARMVFSLLVFLPFLRLGRMSRRLAAELVLLGMVQYGLMYLYYLHAYTYLDAHQVALFTIFTPVYVTLIHDLAQQRFHRLFLLTALLAVAGTGVIVYTGDDVSGTATGFLLVQVSNLCFAFGQVRYRELTSRHAGLLDHEAFALLYLGACFVSAIPLVALAPSGLPGLTLGQLGVLVYLGVVPAGVGFFLWNVGARRVNAGTLAAMNNVKIPLAILVSIALFGERPAVWPLLAGGSAILSAVWFNERYTRTVLVEGATRK